MSRNWTQGQLDAIRARGGTLLVSAAAGSGKTAVLVERVIERLTDPQKPTDADRLLIVTFTKAAAAEMRSRIAAEISGMLEADPFNTRLQRQQLLLSRAHISTIDSFCADLVHQNFFKLGISPDMRVLDDSEIAVLRTEAIGETLEAFYAEGSPDFGTLVEAFSTGRDDAAIAGTVGQLYDFVRSHPFSEKWMREKSAMYEGPESAAQTVWGKTILSFAEDAADYGISLLRDSLARMDSQISEAYAEAFQADLAVLQSFRDAVRGKDWDKAYFLASTFTSQRLKTLKGHKDDPLKVQVTAAKDEVKKKIMPELARLLCAPDKECREDISRLSPIVKELFRVTQFFSDTLEKKKKERHAADFSDLEHLALKLLVRETETGCVRTPEAEELSAAFDEIMVDEYQDTNETQDLIFRAVSQKESNLFMVGDVKQSIYRFRQAMPKLFLSKRAQFPIYDREKESYPACVVLGRNFRSRPGVTDAVNFVFRQLMSRQAGELDYNSAEELVPQASYPPCEGSAAELDVIDLSGGEDDLSVIQAESRQIAKLVYGMMDGKPRITENGKLRPAVFRDFCILLRSANRPSHEYVRELTALGIPAWADTTGGFFGAYEVSMALSLLQVIDNPAQDIPLLSVMMSPIYGFTADDMAKIRLKSRTGRLYPAVAEAAQEGGRPAEFLKELGAFRTFAAAMPADRLIRTVFEKTGLFDLVQAMPNGELRLANLRLLLDYAKKYESAGSGGLTGFLRFLGRMKESRGDLSAATALSESADVVRIMSIHHSKGLEFPVCIVAGCAHRFNRDMPAVLLHPELGLGTRLAEKNGIRRNTMPRAAVELALKHDDMSEELRVLYVAMTRAKEKLVLVTSLPNAERTLGKLAMNLMSGDRIPPYVVHAASSISDWLLLCALRHPDGHALREAAGMPEAAILPAKERWDIRLIHPENAQDEEEAQEISSAEPDPKLEKKIAAAVDYVYPYAALHGVCAKAAVSQLAGSRFEGKYAASSRPAFLSETGLTPAERGTALHIYLQFADYRRAREDPLGERNRLTKEKYLTPLQADAIELPRAEAFFASPLMKRILDSPHYEREVRFSTEIPAGKINPKLKPPMSEEQVVLQGAADLVFEEDGSLVLVDFKTDHTKDAAALWERYREQLDLYQTELERCSEKKVKECLLYSFFLNREISENNL